jgi:signal transduction histidine kinase
VAWPPSDLDQIRVHIQVLAPRTDAVLFDSNAPDAIAPFSLADLKPLLLPGETLSIYKLPRSVQPALISLTGGENGQPVSFRLLGDLIRRLPVEGYDLPIASTVTLSTSSGKYELVLRGDISGVNKSLSAVATRLAWFVGAMLLAIMLAWVVIEIGIIRRMTMLNHRAIKVSQSVRGTGSFDELDLTDLRSGDELGLLARCLADLLQRVREDVERQRIRAEQENDMWHAVGHEIMSPLQSLMVLHGNAGDDSSRYINRMQQAIRILYGSASPSEAFQSGTLQDKIIDLHEFLKNVAGNAPCAGIENVVFLDGTGPVMVRADDYSLEDVVTHVLRNADRYRTPCTPITLAMQTSETTASVTIRNQGPNVSDLLIDKIFEYGVSDQQDSGANGNRGQGLFVARTYMAKMGGTITVMNEEDGVSFVLTLARVLAR